jgi:hypothetical protein
VTSWIVPGLALIAVAVLVLAAAAGGIRREIRALGRELDQLDALARDTTALVAELHRLAAERAGRRPDAR